MGAPPDKPPIDHAFRAESLKGGARDPTYAGALSFMRRLYSRDLAGADVAILGVPSDLAVSNRPGARFGPQAIRRASAILDGDPHFPWGFDIFADMATIDYGDCALDLHHPETVAGAIEAEARRIVEAGVHLLALGGDHFVSWPLMKAHAARHGPLALVQFDAHQDTWDDDGTRLSHGSFVLRAVREGVVDPERSIQVGIRTHAPQTAGIEVVSAYSVHRIGIAAVAEAIVERVAGAPTYLSFDIDCLDPAYAPGTGTPVAGGLTSAQALMILAGLGRVRFVGADIVEVSPPYDHADITALAAATVAQHYLGLLAKKRAAG